MLILAVKKANVSVISVVFCVLFSVLVTAQEAPVSSEVAAKPLNTRLQLEKAERESQAMNGLKVEKKLTGRLPNGYRTIVTNKQRDEMYSIQKEYAELIELLKIRIELLEQESAKQIDALLEPDQVQKIKEANGNLESEKLLQKNKTKPKAKSAKENASE
ncbi:MAG: hypothetical protein LBP87_02790 [Planctomycetaceae bacterium]|nr:hypothetical protein [Planctomycetaceae bacterium]